jgi:hypothetical protein
MGSDNMAIGGNNNFNREGNSTLELRRLLLNNI